MAPLVQELLEDDGKKLKTIYMDDKNSFATIVFTPSGIRGRVKKTTILEAAQTLSVDLNSICGARGRCSKCQVEPTFGEFSKLNILSNMQAYQIEMRLRSFIEINFIYLTKEDWGVKQRFLGI